MIVRYTVRDNSTADGTKIVEPKIIGSIICFCQVYNPTNPNSVIKREMNVNEMPVSSQQVETGTSQIRLVSKLQRMDVGKRINLEHK